MTTGTAEPMRASSSDSPIVRVERRSGIDRRRATVPRSVKRQRTLLLADDSLVMAMVAETLRGTSQFEVVGIADDVAYASDLIGSDKVDVLILDGDSPTALADLLALRPRSEQATLIAITASDDPRKIAALFEAGADATISKSVSAADLAPVIRHVARGTVWVRRTAPLGGAARTPDGSAGDLKPLTRRELQMLVMVGEGLSNKEIGRKVWVTEQTVKFHLSNIYRKLGVSNRTEACKVAYNHGLLNGASSVTELTAPQGALQARTGDE